MATPAELQKLLDGPALAPPLGVEPNFVDPPNLKTLGLVVIILCLILPTLAVWMRMYTKLRIIRQVVAEDCRLRSASLFSV